MDTLIGGTEVAVQFEDGHSESVKLEQLKLKDYKRAFTASDDEMALTSILCGKPEAWAQDLKPESYEALVASTRAVNEKGFFVYAARQTAALMERMNRVSPEVLRLASEKVSKVSPPGLLPK